MHRSVKATIGCVLVLGAVTLVWAVFFNDSRNGTSSFRLAAVKRGPIISAVSTSGTLNAVITVQVGSQVSGQIKELLADFNSEVKAGHVIARIDPETFEAKVRQAQAEMDVARANVHIQRAGIERAQKELANAVSSLNSAKARTEKARVTLVNAKRNLERRRVLFQSGSVSESQIDDAQTVHDQTLAQMNSDEADERAAESMVATREAALKTSRAQVDYAIEQVRQKEAALNQAEVDLDNTFIRSPVDGVVIERAVDIGQTVAATFQAPKLFVIAQDLRQMQVETDVDEADIGRVLVGQEAIFTVDAFAGREFHGQVLQVRKAPRIVQNVVTYTVLVSADNADLRLLPGMTANIQVIVDERQNALKVPNAALRFKPNGEDTKSTGASPSAAAPSGETAQPEERLKQLTAALRLTESQQNQVRVILSEAREKLEALRRQDAPPEEIRRETQAQRERTRNVVATLLSPAQREKYVRFAAAQEVGTPLRGKVYVAAEKNNPQLVDLVLGISDGTFTEVVSGDLNTGQQVIIGVNLTGSENPTRAAKRFAFAEMTNALLKTEDLTKDYLLGSEMVHALCGVSVEIMHGDFVAVTGPSGSGKSTFMNLLGCLDSPTSGRYILDGSDVSRLTADDLSDVRNRKIGFVFQNFNLLARTPAIENVELPLRYSGMPRSQRHARAREVLEAVGLADRGHHHPSQLSGGQQQRVAIARALANHPVLVLADEPTGAIDTQTSVEIMHLLQRLNRDGITIILVTHEPDIAKFARRILRFRDGRIIDPTMLPNPTPPEAVDISHYSKDEVS